MRIPLCDENRAAIEKLRPETNDRSGIGVHYVDACLKPLKSGVILPDGSKFTARRRGLKVTLACGPTKGEGLMRRLVHGPDPVIMLRAALDEASENLGMRLVAEHGKFYIDLPDDAAAGMAS